LRECVQDLVHRAEGDLAHDDRGRKQDVGSDPRIMRQIASETGAAIGGTLYSDSLTNEKGEAPTYIAMVRHNISTIASALAN